MNKINFENLPSTNTAISAENLNLMQEYMEQALDNLKSVMYPIGSIKMTTTNTNPSTYLGGTWAAWGSGKVPVGVDTSQTEFATVEKTGGEKTHTLIRAEMPKHGHTFGYKMSAASGSAEWNIAGSDRTATGDSVIDSVGGDQPHNNLQPYITCYMWKRTA